MHHSYTVDCKTIGTIPSQRTSIIGKGYHNKISKIFEVPILELYNGFNNDLWCSRCADIILKDGRLAKSYFEKSRTEVEELSKSTTVSASRDDAAAMVYLRLMVPYYRRGVCGVH